MKSEYQYALALAHFEKASAATFRRLHARLGSYAAMWQASDEEMRECGMRKEGRSAFAQFRASFDFDFARARMEKSDCSLLLLGEESYPGLLAEIHDPPLFLFARGAVPTRDEICLAVVGTRRMTPYGTIATKRIVGDAARSLVIVSGLALGLDGCAHETTLAEGGRTVAVLASGIDDAHISPRTHYGLAQRILRAGGCLISEYPPGSRAAHYRFPIRNRIIAGLSRGTLIIEAGQRSGSLITAYCALNENRDVFAVPGPITSDVSAGPNALLKKGARPVTCADDIFEEWNMSANRAEMAAPNLSNLTRDEAAVLACVCADALHVDQIAAAARLDITMAASTLLIMELKGLVRNIGGMRFIKA